MKKIATDNWNPEYAGYILDDQGIVRHYSYSKITDNLGTYEEFVKQVKLGKFGNNVTLIENEK